MADINFDAGTISEALNRKVDLPTNPERAQDQIDYVVDFQAPTASNNYTWYRKFKSGWVEQGGILTPVKGGENTVNLVIEMADVNYIVIANNRATSYGSDQSTANKNTTANFANVVYEPTTTSFNVRSSTEQNINGVYWQVSGMAA